LGNENFITLPKSRRAADILRKVDFSGATDGKLESQFLQVRNLTKDGIILIRDIVNLIGSNLHLSEGVMEAMRVLLSELFQNAIDHSGRNSCYVCAGIWGRSSHVHVSIVDFGVGIPNKLRTKYLGDNQNDDSAAVKLVLENGVTTREQRVGGFGYSFIKNFLQANKGRLRIYTGSAKADYNFARSEYFVVKKREMFSGTCVDIQINKDRKNFYQLFGENKEHYF
jgi:anti-sigma regulatory factor (Ser/Thr protein kinase)